MTRSFIKRAAAASVLLALGLLFVRGDNSLFDKVISKFNIVAVAIVLAVLVAFWVALALWVVLALKPSKWARHEAAHGNISTLLSIIAAGLISAQPCQAWTMVPKEAQAIVQTNQPVQAVQINQPFVLTPDEQAKVDKAIADVSKEAQDQVGFTVSVELAIGIFIAAVVVGTVVYIIVRMVCKSLDRMKQSLNSRLARLKEFLSDPTKTNTAPDTLGAALFNHRPATTSDLQDGAEFNLRFAASAPATITGTMASGESLALDEFVADFGVTDKLPLDSASGTSVSREGSGYKVTAPGFTNFVTVAIESTASVAQSVWHRSAAIRVPAGAILDFADVTGNSDGRFWRVGVAQ